MVNEAIRKLIDQQSKVTEYSAQWMVAEQLKDICRKEPHCAELIAQDLEQKEMSIVAAEKTIKAFADKRRKGNSSCVSPMEAEKLLREFYSLPPAGERPEAEPVKRGVVVNLADFFG